MACNLTRGTLPCNSHALRSCQKACCLTLIMRPAQAISSAEASCGDSVLCYVSLVSLLAFVLGRGARLARGDYIAPARVSSFLASVNRNYASAPRRPSATSCSGVFLSQPSVRPQEPRISNVFTVCFRSYCHPGAALLDGRRATTARYDRLWVGGRCLRLATAVLLLSGE